MIALWKTSNNIKLKNAIEDGIRKIDIFTSQLKIKHVNFDNLNKSKFDPFHKSKFTKDLIIAMQILGKLPPLLDLLAGLALENQHYVQINRKFYKNWNKRRNA